MENLWNWNPEPGVQWHATWPRGRIEPNRKIYDFELVYFSAGSARIVSDSGNWECPAGSVVIIPPKQMHCTVALTAVERWCIHFDWYGDCRAHREAPRVFLYSEELDSYDENLTARMPENLELQSFPLLVKTEPEKILPLLRSYFLIGEQASSPGGVLRKKGLLCQILGTVLEEKNTDSAPPRVRERNTLFLNAKNCIDVGFENPELCVTGIARECGITPNHLTKIFRRVMGMSVSDYLRNCRLEFAENLLTRRKKLTVREIAFLSGFNDPNYFMRFFRRSTGKTPGEFREER